LLAAITTNRERSQINVFPFDGIGIYIKCNADAAAAAAERNVFERNNRQVATSLLLLLMTIICQKLKESTASQLSHSIEGKQTSVFFVAQRSDVVITRLWWGGWSCCRCRCRAISKQTKQSQAKRFYLFLNRRMHNKLPSLNVSLITLRVPYADLVVSLSLAADYINDCY